MLLRAATPADLPDLLDVQEAGAVRALAHIFPQDAYPFPRADVAARWAAEMADPGIDVWVAEHDGRLAGFVAVRGDELLHFGTAVGTWGTGLAAAVHDEVLTRMAAAGAARMRLWVFEENRRARRFYERRGWRATGRRVRSSFPPRPVLLEYDRDL